MRVIISATMLLVLAAGSGQTHAQPAVEPPADQVALCDKASDFAVRARTEHDQGVPLEKVLADLDSPAIGLTRFETGFFKRTARAVYSSDMPGTPATIGRAWKALCLNIGKHPAVAAATPLQPPAAGQGPGNRAVSSPRERCEVAGKFVEMARKSHDEGMPIDLFLEGIDRAAPRMTDEDVGAYKNLARLAYAGPEGTPVSYRENFVTMCTSKLAEKGAE